MPSPAASRARALLFEYREASETGSGWFELLRDGRFSGEYVAEGAAAPRPWTGNRQFDGVWHTTLGTMRLIQDGARVTALIDGPQHARIECRLDGDRLELGAIVPGPAGSGVVEIDPGGLEFNGQWRAAEGDESIEVRGVRAMPRQGTAWLVVLEAHWQRSLADSEYAFGYMLQEVFARLPHVQVRHRFFHDEASLLHWCHELQFQPEPTVLVIASHGEPEGVSVHGKIVDTERIIDSLATADSLALLHFSCCLIAKNGDEALANPGFPVSGYATSVDWLASALIEFTLLDMVLAKGLPPERAAEQVVSLIGFAGNEPQPGSPYAPAGFRFVGRRGTPHSAVVPPGIAIAPQQPSPSPAPMPSTIADTWQALRRLMKLA